jgi:hypothetical protein
MEELKMIWNYLTREILPDMAKKYNWPKVKRFHSFQRIALDNTFQDVWYNHLSQKKGAIHTISEKDLLKAIAMAMDMASDPSGKIMSSLNRKSLQYRGKL